MSKKMSGAAIVISLVLFMQSANAFAYPGIGGPRRPQGEYYPDHPTVEQLRVLYGK